MTRVTSSGAEPGGLPGALRPSSRGFRWLGIAMAVALLTGGMSLAPVRAQDSGTIEGLNQKIERLQGELNDLQRAVYNDEVETPVPEPAPSVSAAGEGSGLTQAAGQRLQRRIESLESDLRRMTGQVEETRHQLNKVTNRLDKLVADVDFRLRELEDFRRKMEDTDVAAGSDSGEGSQTADNATEPETQETGGETAGGEEGAGTLGQVSQDAVAELQAEAGQGADEADNADSETNDANAADRESAGTPDNGNAGDTGAAEPAVAYKKAFGLLQKADYAAAEEALGDFIAAHADHDLAGNAKYWLGETYYVRENYEQAAVIFAEGFRTYPESRKAPDNLLKLGMSLAKIDKVDKACRIFSELQNRFPEAPRNIRQRAKRERSRLSCGG